MRTRKKKRYSNMTLRIKVKRLIGLKNSWMQTKSKITTQGIIKKYWKTNRGKSYTTEWNRKIRSISSENSSEWSKCRLVNPFHLILITGGYLLKIPYQPTLPVFPRSANESCSDDRCVPREVRKRLPHVLWWNRRDRIIYW